MKHILAIVFVLATANVLVADDDDDDNGVGLRVARDFELSQDLVFGVRDGVRVYADGNLKITGGQVRGGVVETRLGDGIDLEDRGTVSVSDGDIAGTDDAVKAKNNSTVNISGGMFVGADDGISAVNDSEVFVSGGSITGGFHGLLGRDLAKFNVSDGMITGPVGLNGESSLRISGGSIAGDVRLFDRSTLNILGGSIEGIIEADGSSHVNLFIDPETAKLLDGTAPHSRIFATRLNEDVRRTSFRAVTESLALDRTASGNFGVVSNSEAPTRLEVNNSTINSVYLLDHSEATINNGRVVHGITADDTSRVAIHSGTFGQNQREGILAKRNSIVDISGGTFEGYTHGIQLQGRSRTSIADGTFRGRNRDAIHMLNYATVNIANGVINGIDEGIRASDNSTIVLSGGSISGNSNGISISESTLLRMRGGSVDGVENGLRMRDSTRVEMSAGRIFPRLLAENSSQFTMSGGEIIGDIVGRKSAEIEISGGHVDDDIRLSDQTQLRISGGVVRGDITVRDNVTALISGGNLSGDLVAEDFSTVRIVGNDLTMSRNQVLGKLMDGSNIRGDVLKEDKASIELFEGLRGGSPIDGSLPSKNYAIVDTSGRDSIVDILPGADIAGNVTVLEGSRVNIFGGSFENAIKIDGLARLHVYASDYTSSFEFGEASRLYLTTVVGNDIHGEPVEYQFIDGPDTYSGVHVYEVIDESMTLPRNRGFNQLALFDGADGPTTVRATSHSFIASPEIRQRSTLITQSHIQGSFEAISLWDEGTLNMSDGSATSYDGEAILARDAGTANVSGGTLFGARDGIRVWDNARLNFSGGTVNARDDGIDIKHLGNAVVSGGTVVGENDAVKAADGASITIAGGELFGTEDGVSLAGNARATFVGDDANVTAGSHGVLTVENAYAEIHNGSIAGESASIRAEGSSVIHVFGGEFENPLVAAGGTLLLVGSSLSIDEHGVVTGELLDRSTIEWQTEKRLNGSVEILNTYPGDANLDGEFNSTDFVFVFAANEYEDDIALNSTWAEGDWNGDGEFNTTDMVYAFNIGGYERGPIPNSVPVPEPTAMIMFMLGISAFYCLRRLNHRSHL